MTSNSTDNGDHERDPAGNHGDGVPELDHDSEQVRSGGAGLSDVAADLGRGLGGIVEGIGSLFTGLARAGLEAAEGAAGGSEERGTRGERESSEAAEPEHDGRTDRSADDGDER